MTMGTRGNTSARLLAIAWVAACTATLGVPVGAQNPAPAPSTDVYVYRPDRPQDGVLNITKRAGYDNQPSYLGARLAWTSQRDGQTDIRWLNLETEKPFTATPESEYSAAITPDGKGVSVIRVEMDSAQRLWTFPLGGGTPSVVLPDIKPVGYFAYLDANTLALFVLGSPNTLQIADIRTGKGVVVTTGIGRSLQHVPGGRRASFTQRVAGTTLLQTVDPTLRADGTFAIDTVAALPDSADFVVWKSATHVVTGAGSRLMQLRLPSREWEVLADLGPLGIRRISRLALSPDSIRIAFVADEPRP
jgi:hypothetical protein